MEESKKGDHKSIQYVEQELQELFLNDWNKRLKETNTFSEEDKKRMVSKENVAQILKAIEID